MHDEYELRYRITASSGASALIVADQRGNAYLYAAGALQFRATNDENGERLIKLLGAAEHWEPLSCPGSYSLAALRRLGGHSPGDGGSDA